MRSGGWQSGCIGSPGLAPATTGAERLMALVDPKANRRQRSIRRLAVLVACSMSS